MSRALQALLASSAPLTRSDIVHAPPARAAARPEQTSHISLVSRDGRALVSSAVREALLAVVSPEVCERLIDRSLASQGIRDVPESGDEIADWLDGALRSEVESLLGIDTADVLMMQLGPIAAYAAISASAPQRASNTVPAPRRAQLPRTVLVASRRPDALTALRGLLASSADVVAVTNLAGLLDALESPAMREAILVIDCQAPSVQVVSLSTMRQDLPRDLTVVLWGVDDALSEQLERGGGAGCSFICCSNEASAADVGNLCATFLG